MKTSNKSDISKEENSMCYDDMLRKIYTATSQNQLENCLDELYTMCYVDEDITEAENFISECCKSV